MIVRPTPSGLLLITQPDHAALAARVMREWRADGLRDAPRRRAILLAIEEHDNGWREVDAAPIVDGSSGRVLDYVGAPDEIRRAVWPRGVERLAAEPWAAALVAQHAVHVLRRYRSDPAWTAFFTELEALRDRYVREAAPMTLDDMSRDYRFLRIGDLLSLTFCNGWAEIQADDAGSGYTFRLDGTRLTITPDPFEGRDVALEIAARQLPDRPFRSTADAQDAFAAAPTVIVKAVASGR